MLLHNKSNEVCIKTRSPLASLPFKGQVTEKTTVKCSIGDDDDDDDEDEDEDEDDDDDDDDDDDKLYFSVKSSSWPYKAY